MVDRHPQKGVKYNVNDSLPGRNVTSVCELVCTGWIWYATPCRPVIRTADCLRRLQAAKPVVGTRLRQEYGHTTDQSGSSIGIDQAWRDCDLWSLCRRGHPSETVTGRRFRIRGVKCRASSFHVLSTCLPAWHRPSSSTNHLAYHWSRQPAGVYWSAWYPQGSTYRVIAQPTLLQHWTVYHPSETSIELAPEQRASTITTGRLCCWYLIFFLK